MATFRYQAMDADRQTVAGRIEADDERDAQRALGRRGMPPIAISPVVAAPSHGRIRRRPRVADHALLLRELSVLVGAGMPLADAVQSLAESRRGTPVGAPVERIGRHLRNGQGFAASLRDVEGLPDYVLPLVQAGEMTGGLQGALADAARQMDKDLRLQRAVRQAVTYPAMVVTVGLATVLFVFLIVVPRFAALAERSWETLPGLSRVVLGLGLMLRDHPLASLGVPALLAVAAVLVLQGRRTRAWLYEAAARLPLMSDWIVEAAAARWCGMAATLLANRVPLLDALDLARATIRLPRLRSGLAQVERSVRNGTTLSQALASFTPFGATIVGLVRVGERSGALAEMLASAAELCDQAVEVRTRRILVLIEPAAILLVGALIGTIVVAIILSITSLNSLVTP